jgi:lysophospholipase L1-like esterase
VGLLTAALILGCLEVGARVMATVVQDRQRMAEERPNPPEDWFVYSPTLGWERKPGYRSTYAGGPRAFDSAGYLVDDSVGVVDSTRRTVLFIGDSNTFGYGVPTETSFVAVVKRTLPGIRTINLGVPGYSSYQGRLSIEAKLALLKPDLLVAGFGYNDRRAVIPPEGPDGPTQFRRIYEASHGLAHRLSAPLESSYLYRAIRALLQRVGVVPAEPRDTRVDDLQPRVNEEAFRANLSRIVEFSNEHRVPVIFMALGDNPLETELVREGIAHFEQMQYTLAVAYLDVAVGFYSPFSDLARLYLVRTLLAMSDTSQAATAAVLDDPTRSLHGGDIIRLDTDYNDIMKQVALTYGVPVVDAAAVLADSPADYLDAIHFNESGHRKVGEVLAAQIKALLGPAK